MIRNGKKRNVAVTAIARELACFIWGMMTGNTLPRNDLRVMATCRRLLNPGPFLDAVK